MIQPERVKPLNRRPVGGGRVVVYWMQASQRARWNQALEYAIQQANEHERPLIVYFGLTDDYPEANDRHYRFMLEGLIETERRLRERGISMVVRHEAPEKGVVRLAKEACLVVVDRGYLRVQTGWREYASRHLECPLIQVESDVVVPVEVASPKEEFTAATFRPKIRGRLEQFLVPVEEGHPHSKSLSMGLDSLDLSRPDDVMSRLKIDHTVGPVDGLKGGTSEAENHLETFVRARLEDYESTRNDPNKDSLSNLSPYLHFGQISALFVALQVLRSGARGRDAYLEELIVRRELSINYVRYNGRYDDFQGLPAWAKSTLDGHRNDLREYLYSLHELEQSSTHDPYWNAAQTQMRDSGKMHGYMRMYWGKKILEWSRTPEESFRTALYLNNRYELDGRDPNGFAGVAWCFGKHDRPWRERPIFGKVRYMNASGLKRKFDADRYAAEWSTARNRRHVRTRPGRQDAS